MDKFLDLITKFIQITGNETADNIILAVIGVISFLYAFGIIGVIFDFFGLYDSDLMSDLHWIVRAIIFLALCTVCIWIAKFINWLCSFQWWVYLIAGIVLVHMFVGVSLLKHFISKKKSKKKIECSNESKTESPTNEESNKRDVCPRCGAPLVKRHGPYGDFYGCQNYSSKNCRYTRKFK